MQIVRDEFGKGDDFAVKITYKSTGRKTDEMISEFRNSYSPRIVVTVDMIATGTDVRPLECVCGSLRGGGGWATLNFNYV